MFTEFLPRHDLRAVELAHTAMIGIQLNVAHLVRDDLGEPSFRGSTFAAWYGDLVAWDSPHIPAEVIPFALRIDIQGNASLQVPHAHLQKVIDAIGSLVPTIFVDIQTVMPSRRANR